jgi:hypothetical protein
VFDHDRFLGIDESLSNSGSILGVVDYSLSASVKAGFQSTLHFEGGQIDADLDYNVTINTNYNKTTDVLQLDPLFSLLSGTFNTTGPEGSYKLDFIFNYNVAAKVGLNFVVDSVDIVDVSFGDNFTQNLIDLDSSDPPFVVPLPAGLSVQFEWPHISTTGAQSGPNSVSGDGASNNFFQANVDVDKLLFTLLGLPDPFEVPFNFAIASGQLDIIDLDVNGGINFLQEFDLIVNSLGAKITFENGVTQDFSLTSPLTLSNASSYDVDNDDKIEFTLLLDPDANLSNDTELGFNLGYSFDLLKISGSYDVPPVGPSGTFSGSVFHSEGNTGPLASIDVFDSTFALNLSSQQVQFFA